MGLVEGGAFVLGDLDSDHWCIFIVDRSDVEPIEADAECSLNIMMYDLDPAVSQIFTLRPGAAEGAKDGLRAAKESGLDLIVPGAQRDDWMFAPCGYSMNAQQFGTFYTVHVTPENEFSYASFETNLRCKSYASLIKNVLRCFRPGKFTITTFADEGCVGTMVENLTDEKCIELDGIPQQSEYIRTSNCSMQFKTDFVCSMADYKGYLHHGGLRRNPRENILVEALR